MSSAAFTIVQNESWFLPIWLQYYSRSFSRGNLYVLDHDSTDGCTSAIADRCTPIQVHRDRSFDHTWLSQTVSAFQRFLLQSYERVLFVEVDEVVVPEPAFYSDLADYIARCRVPLARCTGFEVVHYRDEEPAIRLDAPLLAQRHYWHASELYSKPLLASEPVTWVRGFHEATSHPGVAPDPHLFLVHLHRLDYDACVARHRKSAAAQWNERDLAEGHGIQNRLTEEDAAFQTWFYRGIDNSGRVGIPPRLKALL